MESSPEVVVIGSGPAGLAAAAAARAAGSRVLVVEREEKPGGILKQCIHDGFGLLRYGEALTGPEYAVRAWRESIGAEVLTATFLHELEHTQTGFRLTLINPSHGLFTIEAAALVMATGCRERTGRQIFLHGERPAGIFTAGQAQRFVNIFGQLPGRRCVILGSGDIGLIMARRLTLEGAEVAGVFEVASEPQGLARNVAQCIEDFAIQMHLSATVSEVHGERRVEAVTVCDVDRDGRQLPQTQRRVACDSLVLSVGLIPENEIVEELGIALRSDTRGPSVSQDRQTVLPGLFVCGNALHVYDLVDYVSTCGEIAGRAAAEFAGRATMAHSAAGGRPPSPDRTQPAHVEVDVSGPIRSFAPHWIDPIGQPSFPIYFRPAETLDGATFELRADGKTLLTRPLQFIRPQQMEEIDVELDPATLQSTRRWEITLIPRRVQSAARGSADRATAAPP